MANHSQLDLQVSSKTIFVTGASGFIGARLVAKLLQHGYQVRVMVRPEIGKDARIPKSCEQVSVNITDVEKLSGVIADSSAVLYCAGSVRGRKPADFETANVRGVKAMLSALELCASAPPLMLLSSLAASRPHLSDYANSKFEGEQLLQAKSELPWTIIRPSAVYGPGDREMLPLLKIIRRGLLLQTGPHAQRLSLLHVDDLVDAIFNWLAASQQCLHQTYSIDDGTPGGYSWDAIGEAVNDGRYRVLKLPPFLLNLTARANLLLSSLFGYMPMLTPGKVHELSEPEWLCDNSEFTQATGWRPALDLRLGAQQLFGETGHSSTH